MTLEEKIGQMNLVTSDWDVTGPTMRANYKEDIKAGKVGAVFNAFTSKYTRQLQEIAVKETRLHIPLLFGYDVIHGHRTIFPMPIGLSASWDLKLIEQSARVAATEASAEGLHWAFGPMVDIARDPRWGRMAEGSGEDTYLGSEIAKAMVRGYQGTKIGDLNSVMACVKHYAAYGAVQAGRDYHTVDMSDRTLREVYLPPYKAAVDAGSATVMTSFNELNGVPATANKYLLNDILRKEWGFDGFIVSDYTSVMELLPHGFAKDTADAAALSINAGMDMDMQAAFYVDKLPQLVKDGKVSEQVIDASVRRILKRKFELGLFDNPYRYCNEQNEKETVMKSEFIEFAREVGRKSIVLLKNEKQLLPFSKSVRNIAVIGPLADAQQEMIGSWSAAGDWKKSVTLLEGIKSKLLDAKITYAKGCNIKDDDTSGFAEAVRTATLSDIVLLAVGEGAQMTGEAASRSSLDLPGVQQQLIEEIQKSGKPIVVVLMNGRPLTINWIDKNIPAILETWFLGTQAGNSIADVLFGDYNPSGKLTVTFPKSVGQIPLFYNMKNTGRPRDPNNKYTSKYLDIDNDPLYPFGFGLSYAQFTYDDVVLDRNEIASTEELTIKCKVTNTGKFEGEETVQFYIRDMVGSVTRPVKELKGFQKVKLKPGESSTVTFKLTSKDLAFYGMDMTYHFEPGDFEVYIGGNSRDVKKAAFTLK
ncbi:glycosyl hydrolase [Cytophagales bacterium WSM2-2]|nr:glycosyl hydrolase [Cytophagales bacterium WSM2-2]